MEFPTTSSCPPNDQQPPSTWIFLALFLFLLLAWFCYIIKRLCWRVPTDKDDTDDTYEDIDGADYTNVSLVTMPTTSTNATSKKLPLLEPSRQLHYINMPNFHIGAFSEIQCPVNGISNGSNDFPIVQSNATERGCLYVNDLNLKRHLKKRKILRFSAFRKPSHHYYSNIKDVTLRFKKDPSKKNLRTFNCVSKQLSPTHDKASTSPSPQGSLDVPGSNQLSPTQDEASTSPSPHSSLHVPGSNQISPTQDEASTSPSPQSSLYVPGSNQISPTQDEASTSPSPQGSLYVPGSNQLSPTGDNETLPEGINCQSADLPQANVRSRKNVQSCNAALECETPLLVTTTRSRSRRKPMHYFKRRTKPSDFKKKDGAERRFLFTSYTLHMVGRFSHVFNMVDIPYIED